MSVSDLEADLFWLGSHHKRWSLSPPVPGVKDWTIVVWRDVPVRRPEHGEVVEAERLVEVFRKAADWFRENG